MQEKVQNTMTLVEEFRVKNRSALEENDLEEVDNKLKRGQQQVENNSVKNSTEIRRR